MRSLILRSQLELLTELEETLGDAGNALWSEPTGYRAINVGITNWAHRVVLPRSYPIPNGITAGIYEYSIPYYVGDNFRPYVAIYTYDQPDEQVEWVKLSGWSVEPKADGSRLMRIYLPYRASGRIADAKLIWYAENGPVPTTPVTLAGTLAADGSSLTTSTAPTAIPDVGWVKINGEWMSYAGVERGASSVTLLGLVRGLHGTTAASHSSTPVVYWGVGVDDNRLWSNLFDSAIADIHYRLLHRGTHEDRLNHEKIMGYSQDRADRFWKRSGYVTGNSPVLKLSRGGWA